MEPSGTEKTEGWIEFYDSFNDMFQFFCNNTTIHGAIRLNCSRNNKMKTTFWIVLFLVTLGMMYWQFGEMTGQYWSYPTSTSISVHSDKKIFPAMTICNLNPYRFAEVNEYIKQLDQIAHETLSSLYEYNAFNTTQRDLEVIDLENILDNLASQINESFRLDQRLRLLKLQEDGLAPAILGQKKFKVGFKLCKSSGEDCFYKSFWSGVDALHEWYRFHFVNIMSKVPLVMKIPGLDIKSFIFSCVFNGKNCDKREYSQFHHPIYGNCFTFNSQGKESFWNASRPGKQYGLSLKVKIEQNDNMPILSTAAGARVMIHSPLQTPLVEHEGFDIWPGTETSISIRQDELNHLGGMYSQCTRDGKDVAIKLLYNSSYTTQACLLSCFQYRMIHQCGCGYYFYPLPPGKEYCNYNKYPGWGHCFYRLYERLLDHRLSCFTRCPKPCKETIYQLSAGASKWPASKSKEWIIPVVSRNNGNNDTDARSDVSKINLYFKELSHSSIDEEPAISATLLLSNMGGQWALWFGSSVLSVAEMAELVFDTVAMLIIISLRWHKQKKATVNDSPYVSNAASATTEENISQQQAFPTPPSWSMAGTSPSLEYNADISKEHFTEIGMDTSNKKDI
ncbi:epithelial sodium channel subunit delta isoform X2 [Ascaphus truei]